MAAFAERIAKTFGHTFSRIEKAQYFCCVETVERSLVL